MINSIPSVNLSSVAFNGSVESGKQTENSESMKSSQDLQKVPVDSVPGKDLVNQNIDLKKLNKIFGKLKGLEGKEFAEKAYSELIKFMDLDGIAPKTITWEKNEGREGIIGDFRFYNNSVVFYTDYFLKVGKAEQLATIAHELTHCKQNANMLRTEGLSVEKIAYAYAVSDIKAMLTRNPQFIMQYQQAVQKGKGNEFLQMVVAQWTKKTAKELNEAYADVLKMPKHPLNSPNGKKAQQDWIAQYNTNSADPKSYSNCPLEKEAYAFEKIIANAYKAYVNN